jgi:hypothetical protein
MSLLRLYFAQRRKRRVVLVIAAIMASLIATTSIVWSYTQYLVGWQFSVSGLTESINLKRAADGDWKPVETLSETQVQVDLDMQPTPLLAELPMQDLVVFREDALRAAVSASARVPVCLTERVTIEIDHVPTTAARLDADLLSAVMAHVELSAKEDPDEDTRAKFKHLRRALRSQDQSTHVVFWPGLRLLVAAYTRKYWCLATPILMIPWLFVAAPLIRLGLRKRRNLCLTCGYRRTGLAGAGPCPECGTSPELQTRTPSPIIAQCDEHSSP